MTSGESFDNAIPDGWEDEQLIKRVLAGQTPFFEILIRPYKQRLYRVAKAILRDDAEADDVVQDASVRAYRHLGNFEGRAKFSTWLTRIAIYEALARARRHRRLHPLETSDKSMADKVSTLESATPSPERLAYDRELSAVLKKAILRLPEHYRLVFRMRVIENMSTAESASYLNLSEATIKVRLHRARAFLRKELNAHVGATLSRSF